MIGVLDHRDPSVAGRIHEVHTASYTVERDLIGYADFPPLRLSAADIARETETFLGCAAGDALVGVLSYTRDAGRLHIGRLVVHPDHFRRGIAASLLAAVEARTQLGDRITVSTAERNAPAVALYAKHGYAIVERTMLPDGLVLVLFQKRAGTGRYTLTGPDGSPYRSDLPGTLGGNRRARLYGRLDCPAPGPHLEAGTYQKTRVFFADEASAMAAGYRPCARCLPERYRRWKADGEPGTAAYPWLITPRARARRNPVA